MAAKKKEEKLTGKIQVKITKLCFLNAARQKPGKKMIIDAEQFSASCMKLVTKASEAEEAEKETPEPDETPGGTKEAI